MTKPTFAELLEGAKAEVAVGRGAVNCTYILAAQDKAYPRTCERCGLGPCPFSDRLMAAREKPATPSREEAPERVCLAIDSAGVRVWLDDSDDLDDFTDVTEYLRADLTNREGDVLRALLMCAPHHQGGHSDIGKAISEALHIPFPVTMPSLRLSARVNRFTPHELWPWLEKLEGEAP